MAEPIIYSGEAFGVRYGVGPFKWATCPFGLFAQQPEGGLDIYYVLDTAITSAEGDPVEYSCQGVKSYKEETTWKGPLDPVRLGSEWWYSYEQRAMSRYGGLSRALQNMCCFVQKDPNEDVLYGGFHDSCGRNNPEDAYWVTYDNEGTKVYIHHRFKHIAINKGVHLEQENQIVFTVSYQKTLLEAADPDRDKKETYVGIPIDAFRGVREDGNTNRHDIFSVADISSDGRKILVMNHFAGITIGPGRVTNCLYRICEIVFTVTAPDDDQNEGAEGEGLDGPIFKKPVVAHSMSTLKDHADLVSVEEPTSTYDADGVYSQIFSNAVQVFDAPAEPWCLPQVEEGAVNGVVPAPPEFFSDRMSYNSITFDLGHSDNVYDNQAFKAFYFPAGPERASIHRFVINLYRGPASWEHTESIQRIVGAYYSPLDQVEYVSIQISTSASMSAERMQVLSVGGELRTALYVGIERIYDPVDPDNYDDVAHGYLLGDRSTSLSISVSGSTITQVQNVEFILSYGEGRTYTQNATFTEVLSSPPYEIEVGYLPMKVGERYYPYGICGHLASPDSSMIDGVSTCALYANTPGAVTGTGTLTVDVSGDLFDAEALTAFYSRYAPARPLALELPLLVENYNSIRSLPNHACVPASETKIVANSYYTYAFAQHQYYHQKAAEEGDQFSPSGGVIYWAQDIRVFEVGIDSHNTFSPRGFSLHGAYWLDESTDSLWHETGMREAQTDGAAPSFYDTYSEIFFDYHGSCKAVSLVAYRFAWNNPDFAPQAIRSKFITVDGDIGETHGYKLDPEKHGQGTYDYGYSRLQDCASYNPLTKQIAYGLPNPISWSGVWGGKQDHLTCWKNIKEIPDVEYSALLALEG